MNLTVFQSDKGDCMLLKSSDGRHILVDGGMRVAYEKHVAPALGEMRRKKQVLDVVYVSHVDQDHISGILQLVDDETAWRIYEYQAGNPQFPEPKNPRPPEVKAIWHNAFNEMVDENNAVAIEDMLASTAAVLSGSPSDLVKNVAAAREDLATSVAEAIRLSRRVGAEQLGIKLNAPAQQRLMMVRDAASPPIKVGKMRLHIIAPFEEDLDELKIEWNKWLEDNQGRLKKMQKQADADAQKFAAAEIDDIIRPKLSQANHLAAALPDLTAAAKLGDRDEVTAPNLASLMFYVKEGEKTLLLTGDGHADDIIKGLRHINVLKGTKGLHVNVLKVQHHGSEHNIHADFCKLITADHYIFCGNGEHTNPELEVIRAIADSRFGKPSAMGTNPQVGAPFKLWFNSSSTVTEKPANKKYMKKVESLVAKLAQQSKGQMTYHFLKSGSSFDLPV